MVEGIPLNTPTVTMAHMIKIKQDNPIFIPSKFVEKLKSKDMEEEWAVMIFFSPCTTKIIRAIPTKSSMVKKLAIEYYTRKLFLHDLGIVFNRNNIKTLYSTGICIHDPPCNDIMPYEGYIDTNDLPISEDQLKSELLAMPSIVTVEVTDVDLESTG